MAESALTRSSTRLRTTFYTPSLQVNSAGGGGSSGRRWGLTGGGGGGSPVVALWHGGFSQIMGIPGCERREQPSWPLGDRCRKEARASAPAAGPQVQARWRLVIWLQRNRKTTIISPRRSKGL